ncbi:MAG TPA: Dam family site-specific DNA-(adenine-N6)-methyltransferase [Gammaproteobacteria bacterium]|nr:Dam family site-specific DNA-(adenine-N6)-methyltransferase [Gammaproteobacteria bacterium]
MSSGPKAQTPKPLLKWAGGKRWLLPVLQQIWQPYKDLKLVEPFTGGMAVALGLNPTSALLNDANEHLINFYQQVRKGLTISQRLQNKAEFYYATRTKFNALIEAQQHKTPEAAALFYFLIRTGFNGLCRFNSSGEFNVPFGQHASIKYKSDFLDYQDVLKKWQFKHGDFAKLKLRGDEFIYADPPYDVPFTRYNAQDFTWEDQMRLARWLKKHPGPVVASNQATERIKELYLDLRFNVYELPAPRMISCNGDRTPALEILAVKNIR